MVDNNPPIPHELYGSSTRGRHSSEYNERRRTSSRSRSRSKRSRPKTTDEDGRLTPVRRTKSQADLNHSKDISSETIHMVGRTSDRVQKKRRKRHSLDKTNETPLTVVLQELRDDIKDDSLETFDLEHQTYPGGVNPDYGIMKTKDNVFVEHVSGFSSVPRNRALGAHGTNPSANSSFSWWAKNVSSALDVAIVAQKTWIPASDFCHGLLAGLALMQTIFVDQLLDSSPAKARSFMELYSHFSVTFTTLFYLLISICLISVFDRLDLTHGDWPYLLDVLSVRPRVPWMLVPLYVCGLLLSLAAARSDDWIYLSQFRSAAVNDSQISEDDLEALRSWHVLNSLRCVCVVLGWLVMASSRPSDLLLHRLQSMLSFQESDVKQNTFSVQS